MDGDLGERKATMDPDNYRKGLEMIRGLLRRAPDAIDGFREMIRVRDTVIGRFQPIFSVDSIVRLESEEFRAFLLFENNRHWTNLHRQSRRICADMDGLRTALGTLLDERRPVGSRWNEVVGTVPGMGKAIMSAILLVANPKEYGVWNSSGESGMRALGLWPEFAPGTGSGGKYEALNAVLKRLVCDLGTDLWTLDGLFGYLLRGPKWGFFAPIHLLAVGKEAADHRLWGCLGCVGAAI